jgi:hypothetical protein
VTRRLPSLPKRGEEEKGEAEKRKRRSRWEEEEKDEEEKEERREWKKADVEGETSRRGERVEERLGWKQVMSHDDGFEVGGRREESKRKEIEREERMIERTRERERERRERQDKQRENSERKTRDRERQREWENKDRERGDRRESENRERESRKEREERKTEPRYKSRTEKKSKMTKNIEKRENTYKAENKDTWPGMWRSENTTAQEAANPTTDDKTASTYWSPTPSRWFHSWLYYLRLSGGWCHPHINSHRPHIISKQPENTSKPISMWLCLKRSPTSLRLIVLGPVSIMIESAPPLTSRAGGEADTTTHKSCLWVLMMSNGDRWHGAE